MNTPAPFTPPLPRRTTPRGTPVSLAVIRLRVTCSWCGSTAEPGTPNAPESHTICAPCMATHFPLIRDDT